MLGTGGASAPVIRCKPHEDGWLGAVQQERNWNTVRHREMKTGISEESKRVPIFSFATQQASEFLFSTEKLGPSPRGSDPVPSRLT